MLCIFVLVFALETSLYKPRKFIQKQRQARHSWNWNQLHRAICHCSLLNHPGGNVLLPAMEKEDDDQDPGEPQAEPTEEDGAEEKPGEEKERRNETFPNMTQSYLSACDRRFCPNQALKQINPHPKSGKQS